MNGPVTGDGGEGNQIHQETREHPPNDAGQVLAPPGQSQIQNEQRHRHGIDGVDKGNQPAGILGVTVRERVCGHAQPKAELGKKLQDRGIDEIGCGIFRNVIRTGNNLRLQARYQPSRPLDGIFRLVDHLMVADQEQDRGPDRP